MVLVFGFETTASDQPLGCKGPVKMPKIALKLLIKILLFFVKCNFLHLYPRGFDIAITQKHLNALMSLGDMAVTFMWLGWVGLGGGGRGLVLVVDIPFPCLLKFKDKYRSCQRCSKILILIWPLETWPMRVLIFMAGAIMGSYF